VIEKIQQFWVNSYRTDRIAFYNEIISFVFTVSASMYLALYAYNPDMRFVYPGFLIGAATGFYAYYRRQLLWPMILTGYFCCVNIFGFGRAISWW
jgi:hypothetical protein